MLLLSSHTHSPGTPSAARSHLPSLSTCTRAPTTSCSSSSMRAAHRTPSPSLHSAKPTLHAKPFGSHHHGSSSSCLSASTPSCALASSSSRLFQHHNSSNSSTSRTQRFEAPVPHAGGRGRGSGGQPSPHGRGRSGGRGGGRGRGSLPSPSSPEERVPSLEACLDNIEQLQSIPQLQANPTAYQLYNLGKRVSMETQAGAQLNSECSAILAAADTLAHLLLELRSASSAPLVMQLDSKHLSSLAWGVSALASFDARVMSRSVQQLCYALAERASQPGVVDADVALHLNVACRNVAGVLYGLSKAGVKCGDDRRVQEVFCYAMEEQLPALLRSGQSCNPQSVSNIALACVYVGFEGNMEPFISAVASRLKEQSTSNVMYNAKPQAWSNLIWACGKLVDMKGGKSDALGEDVRVIMREGAAAMAQSVGPHARVQPKAQHLSNTLWGLAHFDWYDAGEIRVLANAFVERIRSSVPQNVANVLLALSSLGWYDRAVYDELLRRITNPTLQPDPQHFSNALYSCAVASHAGPAVDALAHIVSKQDLSYWEGNQHVTNSLYAWAVLSLLGMASAELKEMALVLFREANRRASTFSDARDFTQLHTAHSEAVRVGLQGGGLSIGSGLQQAAAKAHEHGKAELARAKQSPASAAVKEAMAALQQAGYEVQLGGRVGKDGHAVDLIVQHGSCPGGLAIDVLAPGTFFRHPHGQLSGREAAVHAQIRQQCGGLVLLGVDKVVQPDFVVGAVQQELARASGQGGAETSSSSGSSSTASTAPPSHVPSQAPGLLQPKGRPPPSPGPRSAPASPQLKGRPQRKQ